MQILSNVLPGLRELRGPLIAGYLWLIVAWLLVSPDVHARPEAGALGTLYDPGVEVGPIGIFVAVSVAAYLLGAVSQSGARSGTRPTLRRMSLGLVRGTVRRPEVHLL